jgi:capsular polysaccharide biosynthesis protein
MELKQIVTMFVRRWWLIVIPVAIVAVFTVPELLRDAPESGGFSTTVRYTAAQVLEAIPEREGDFQDVWLASELTVNAFTEWVRTNRFRDEVMQIMDGTDVAVNGAALGISADNARSIGQVFLSYPEADALAIIADSVIDVLQTRNQAYFPQLGGVAAEVEILDDPVIVPAPPPLTDRFGAVFQLGLALFAGLGLAVLVDYLDPTLRRKSDLEALGIRVVATIPRR